ncbi:MAG: UDP-N-acetylmuramate dehydrogenase [Candidatus Pacebacteria bacterium]|nr:UDP-N-acetylmuramate dehydrogenase [Candidatus Paceibacterota bacterium]
MLNIQNNVKLATYTTFSIGGKAKYLVEAENLADIRQAVEIAKDKEVPLLIIGGGSNLLISDRDFEGLVIVNKLKGIKEIRERNSNEVLVTAKAGEVWDDLVKYTTKRNYWGLENLAYIPGTVGACPVQNIGAYGREIKDTFVSLEALNIEDLTLRTFYLKDCNFGYRSSIFKEGLKGKYIIVSVTFKLSLLPAPALDYGSLQEEINKEVVNINAEDVRLAVEKIRKSKLPEPKEFGNAGSFFKNPEISQEEFEKLKEKFPDIKYYDLPSGLVKVPAGWLIERAGWKGKDLGLAGVWHQQALIVVNKGGASFNDIKFLTKTIICEVKDKFGIELTPEVNIIE